jgi:hypothetical protein
VSIVIENRQLIFENVAAVGLGSLRTMIEQRLGGAALRWYII